MSPTAIVHCSVPSQSANPIGAPPERAHYHVELAGILREAGVLYVALADERHNWILTAKPSDLASFTRFRRRVAAELKILITHACEEETHFTRRRDIWRDAVRVAHQRGAAA